MKRKYRVVYSEEEECYTIIDENGVILGSIETEEEIASINVTTKKQEEYLTNNLTKKEYTNMRGKYSSYGKINFEFDEYISKLGLSGAELSILLFLRSKVAHSSNVVKKNRNTFMKVSDIKSELGLSINTVKNAISKLISLDIIKLHEDKIYVNPKMSYKGYGVYTDTVKLWE